MTDTSVGRVYGNGETFAADTHDTPEAALNAAMAAVGVHVDLRRGDVQRPVGCNSCKPAVAAILAALDGWTLVPRVNPLSNFGDDENDRMPWQQDEYGESDRLRDAEIARLRAALGRVTSIYERPAGRGKAVEHLIDEGHEIGAACSICAALAPQGPV